MLSTWPVTLSARQKVTTWAAMSAALLSAAPEPDPRVRSRRLMLQGEVANPAAPPGGCYFHPRCPHAIDVCRTETPAWQEISPGHFVGCHRAHELQLAGVE